MVSSILPSTKGTGLDQRFAGVPLIIWAVGGALALGVGYHYYKQRSGQQTNVPASQGGPATAQSGNPAQQNPVAIDPSSAYAQGITDQNGNLLPQFTWPYNQLALPYNYGPMGLGGAANSAYDYTSAQSTNFIGGQYTPVYPSSYTPLNFGGGI